LTRAERERNMPNLYWGRATKTDDTLDFPDAELFLSVDNCLPRFVLRLISSSEMNLNPVIEGARVEEVREVETEMGETYHVHEWFISPTGEGQATIWGETIKWFDVESESSYKVTDFEGHVGQVSGGKFVQLLSDSEEDTMSLFEKLKERERFLTQSIRQTLKKSKWTDQQINQHFIYMLKALDAPSEDDLEVEDSELIVELCNEWKENKLELLQLIMDDSKGH
jgi:hypothetical protein